tara:strand:+ start:322 stop:756 length:435 start_codon:yes stop_codon:yes gene_type:complete
MSYNKPGLPDFCNLGGSASRNRWNESVEERTLRLNREAQAAAEANARNSQIQSTNQNLMNNAILYNRVYYRNLYGGYLPGEDSNYALNNDLNPDGNNLYSNSGLDNSLVDNKKRYYKSYATTIHLTLGILLSLFIIIKKPSTNI